MYPLISPLIYSKIARVLCTTGWSNLQSISFKLERYYFIVEDLYAVLSGLRNRILFNLKLCINM